MASSLSAARPRRPARGRVRRQAAGREACSLFALQLSDPNRSADLRSMGMTSYLRPAGEVLLAIAAAPVAAPLFTGWIAQCHAWLQNRSAPPLTQPYRMLRKLFQKEVTLAADASFLFRVTPYVLFGTMVLAAAIIPTVATGLPLAQAADAIALIGLFATARVFMALAAMDVGTAFGTLAALLAMMIGFLAEPALLMVLFNSFLLSGRPAFPLRVVTYLP